MNSFSFASPLPAALAFALAASASAYPLDSTVSLSGPDVVRPLHSSMRFSVNGPGSTTVPELPRIFVDGIDRSSEADIELVEDLDFDRDGDGAADAARLTYHVDVDELGLAAGQLVEFDLTAATTEGYVHCRTATPVEAHAVLSMNDAIVLGDADPTVLQVEWLEMLDFASALVVRIAGYDVTNLVTISAPVLTEEDVVGSFVASRTEVYELDFSALAGFGLEGLPLTIEAWAGEFEGGLTTTDTTSTIVPEDPLDPCYETALKKFCEALKLTKDAATGAVCSGASAADQKKAADALKDAIRQCVNAGSPPFPSGPQKVSCGGVDMEVSVGGTGQEAKAVGGSDAMVAVGGDGAGNGDGGNAKAVNSQPGGAAIAIGGNGGSGTTSGGDGGNGHAEAKNGSGGTPPGCANGVGGTGGSASPSHKPGGDGGQGYAKTSPGGKTKKEPGKKGSSGSAPSSSNPNGTPGTYGGGGWAQVNGSTVSNGTLPGGTNP